MNDIEAILSKRGIAVQHAPHARVRYGWIGVDCPKCSPHSGKYRLGFEVDTGRCHCWVCGALYAPDAIALLLGTSKKDARDMLGDLPRHRRESLTGYTGTLKIPDGVGPLQESHRAYLASRRLDPDIISDVWGVLGIGRALRLQWRLWIPIYDARGQVVSWTTRATHPKVEPRYWSATEAEEAYPHKSLLYGGHLARHTIIIVEGPVDAWAIGPGAVATCGVGFTAAQRHLMAEYPVRVVCFDAEADAQRRAKALCDDLCLFPGTTENIRLETGKDPGEADPAELDEIRREYFPELYPVSG